MQDDHVHAGQFDMPADLIGQCLPVMRQDLQFQSVHADARYARAMIRSRQLPQFVVEGLDEGEQFAAEDGLHPLPVMLAIFRGVHKNGVALEFGDAHRHLDLLENRVQQIGDDALEMGQFHARCQHEFRISADIGDDEKHFLRVLAHKNSVKRVLDVKLVSPIISTEEDLQDHA